MDKTYREELAQAIGEIEQLMRDNFKSNGTPIPFTYGSQMYDLRNRQARVSVIDRITDDYVRQHAEFNDAAKSAYYARGGSGEGPATVPVDSALLDRLADVLLYEELTDENPHKVANNEYPILSEIQMERRKFGARGSENTNMRGEVALNTDDDIDDAASRHHSGVGSQLATDGKVYRYPIRRTRSKQELIFLDTNTKVQNQRRAEQYIKDTTPGKVERYNLYDNGGELAPSFVDCVGTVKRLREAGVISAY